MKSVEEFNIKFLELAGLSSALKALRLPYGKDCRSKAEFKFGYHVQSPDSKRFIAETKIDINEDFNKDINLISTLIKRGDEHAKVTRGIIVWFEVNAPRYWHVEMDTYKIGAERLSSESTMHIQGQGLDTEALIEMKEKLAEGTMQRRVWMVSYQTLRRIWIQRHNHRLPQWQIFCKWIEGLPYANELILVGLK